MAYSGGMFAVNALSFVFFFITYWVDKIMLLRFNRRPPHREDALQRQVQYVLQHFTSINSFLSCRPGAGVVARLHLQYHRRRFLRAKSMQCPYGIHCPVPHTYPGSTLLYKTCLDLEYPPLSVPSPGPTPPPVVLACFPRCQRSTTPYLGRYCFTWASPAGSWGRNLSRAKSSPSLSLKSSRTKTSLPPTKKTMASL